ncbi:MAG: hypothetical protein BM556_02575 [Bacteriovorax sp. MedPE-SWde]|nr:MAG: hypothetical protein BM556_02575 [Bacteriovorax sp. MedPE-SWde]
MMNKLEPIFEYSDYKKYTLELISTYPKEGRGVFSQLSKSLNVSSVLISKIFKGDKDLSIDQAVLTCDFFEFNELESDYFITLVSKARAASTETRKYFEKKLYDLQLKALDVKNRISKQNEISEEAKCEFYSSWIYTAIRQSCALEEINTEEDLCEIFKLPAHTIREKVEFLKNNGLLKEENNTLSLGMNSTYLSKDNPLIHSHRKNWRLKAIDSFTNNNENDLFFVAPMVISEEIATKLREKLLSVIQELYKDAPEQDAEATYCLNIDLFNF